MMIFHVAQVCTICLVHYAKEILCVRFYLPILSIVGNVLVLRLLTTVSPLSSSAPRNSLEKHKIMNLNKTKRLIIEDVILVGIR